VRGDAPKLKLRAPVWSRNRPSLRAWAARLSFPGNRDFAGKTCTFSEPTSHPAAGFPCKFSGFSPAPGGASLLKQGIQTAPSREFPANNRDNPPEQGNQRRASNARLWASQSAGMSQRRRALRVRPRGWRPSRIQACRSGARKASRMSLRAWGPSGADWGQASSGWVSSDLGARWTSASGRVAPGRGDEPSWSRLRSHR
jgi:hypothetical protein